VDDRRRQIAKERSPPLGTLLNEINGLPQLPKLNVVGSIPIARSIHSFHLFSDLCRNLRHEAGHARSRSQELV